MFERTRVIALAGAAALGLASAAHAADNDVKLSLDPVVLDAAPAPAPPDRPIMYWLEQGSIGKSLKDAGVVVQGHLEGSYVHSFRANGEHIPFRIFDIDQNDVVLNQADLAVMRMLTPQGKTFEWGGMVELIYGRDARFIHSNGLLSNHSDDIHPPPNQLDLTQLYVQLNLPVGNGVLINAGKFVTPLGYETINPFMWGGGTTWPNPNPSLFSHSYLFGFAIPFTNTGVTAQYTSGDWWFMAGFSRGWGQSVKDNNGALDWLASASYTYGDWYFLANLITGPEMAGDAHHWRTVLDGIVEYKPANSQWSFAANGDFGWESHGNATGTGTEYWFGVAGYASYALNDSMSVTGRLEWFRDNNAGINITGLKANYYEATLGMAINPAFLFKDNTFHELAKNVTIRPELRWDHSNKSVYGSSGKKNEYTAEVEMLVRL
jgi:hypothetical protein